MTKTFLKTDFASKPCLFNRKKNSCKTTPTYSQLNAIRSRALFKGTLVVLGLAVRPSQGYPCDLTTFSIVWALRGLPIFRKVGVVGKGTFVILRGLGARYIGALRRALLEHHSYCLSLLTLWPCVRARGGARGYPCDLCVIRAPKKRAFVTILAPERNAKIVAVREGYGVGGAL